MDMRAIVLAHPVEPKDLQVRRLRRVRRRSGWPPPRSPREHGLTVFSTTRNPQHGVDHPIVDDGNIAAKVREIRTEGVHAVLELVGTNALPDTLKAVAVHGTACFTGMLSDNWSIPDFYPMDHLPNGVRV